MSEIYLFLIMFIGLTSCQSDFNHLAFVIQWPPTLCGYSGVHCKPSIDTQRFTMHGIWPGNSTGHSLECSLPPQHSEDYVKDVWEKDANRAKQLHDHWPTFLLTNTDEEFWMHEWEVHGYCTKQTLPAADYFQGAMRVAVAGKGKGLLARVRDEFLTAGIFSKYDETAYKMTDLLIPLGKVTSKKIYISCTPKDDFFAYLKDIHFCMDKTMRRFVDCPAANLDTRGCGPIYRQRKIIVPLRKDIY
ncbi:ribonuclease 3-like [Solanum stenotomum]|uniref:ribonuclease 3-like n=1 Tax=Solanum stenotomum TaxID=172797 RepID=UPI0020D1ECB1|nr:ribonuclease 3-like [Solanum stenotomum]